MTVVKDASPGGIVWWSTALGWAGAASSALLIARVGTAIDTLASGDRLPSGRVAGMALLAAMAAAAAWSGTRFTHGAASEAERRLRRLVVGRVFDLGVAGTQGRSGELLSLATDAVERTARYRAAFLGPVIGALTTPLVVLAVMAVTTDAVTAGWLALLFLAVPIVIGGFQRIVGPIGSAYRTSQARLTAAFLEAIQSLDTLVYANAAGRMAADLARRGEEHRRGLMRLLAGNQLLILVMDAAFSLAAVVAATAIVLARIGSGQIGLGQGVAVLLMTVLLVGPVDVVGQFFYIGATGRAAQRQIEALAAGEAHPEAAPPPATPPAAATGGALVLDHVTAGWPGGEPVVQGVSFRVEPGERVALVGPSGVGKSTVSALIQAHLSPWAGRVVVDGLDTTTDDPAAVRSRLAVVEQRTFLFFGSIADNLRIASGGAGDGELWEALALAGLDEEVNAMPLGLATPVGEHGMLLSGGQAQRLAIARAALRDAPILLLDEPTSEVDLSAESRILEALARLADRRTVLVIAHRPGTVLAADRVVRLDLPHAEEFR